MKKHKCKKDNPNYYIKSMQLLLEEAKVNGIKVGFRLSGKLNNDTSCMELMFIDKYTGAYEDIVVWTKEETDAEKN